jgi:biotin carboxylase
VSRETIIILGAVALQEDAVVAARALGLHTIVCARAADGPAAETCDEFVPIDIVDIDALERLMHERGIRLVYSVGSDIAMPVIGALAQRLGLRVLASREVAETCNDKGRLRAALAGIPGAVPYQVIGPGDDAGRTVTLPCIVKPVDAQGQRGVELVTTDDGFAPAVARAATHSRTGGVIAERFVGGAEVSVNGYLVDGELVFALASDREVWPQFTGLIRKHVVPSAALRHHPGSADAVTDLLAAACRRVGLRQGPVYAQMKVEAGVPYVIEVTPRLDGCHMWQLIKVATGVDLLDATLRHLAWGEPPVFGAQPAIRPSELEFVCREPGTPAPVIATAPEDLASRAYYAPGATIRAINGRFEKVGYHVRLIGPTP